MQKVLSWTIVLLWCFLTSAADDKTRYSLKPCLQNFSWFLIRNYISLYVKNNPIIVMSCFMGSVVIGYKVCCSISRLARKFFWYCYTRYRYYQQNKLFSNIIQSQDFFSGQIRQTNRELNTTQQQFSELQSQLATIETVEKNNANGLQHALTQTDNATQFLLGIKDKNIHISENGRLFLHTITQEQHEIDFLEHDVRERQTKTKNCIHTMHQMILDPISFTYDGIVEKQGRSLETTFDMGILLDRYAQENQRFLDSIQKNQLTLLELTSLEEMSPDIQQQIKEISIFLLQKKESPT